MIFPLGMRNGFGTLIYASERFNMVSNWVDCIFISKTKLGYSVKAYKWAENYRTPQEFVWHRIDSVLNVKDGSGLQSALRRCGVALDVRVDLIDLVGVLSDVEGDPGKLLLDEILRTEGVY